MTNAEARFNNSLRPRKPEGSLGRTAQDVHLDFHTAPELWHSQRPGKGLQAKQSESLRAQDSAVQKPDQNRNNMSHSLYNHPYALNHIQLVKWPFE